MAQVNVQGLREAVATLRALPSELASKNGGPIRGALYAAAKVIKDDAIARAPIGKGTPRPGNLKKNIITVRDRNPRRENDAVERYTVTVRKKRMGKFSNNLLRVLKGGDAWYAHMVEYGTSKQQAQPFMRPAFETKKHEALQTFVSVFSKGVERAVQRARQRGS